MSLYNNFASKDELIVAYLDRRRDEWLAFFDARLEQASSPHVRVLAVFDAYLDHALASPDGSTAAAGCATAPASSSPSVPAATPSRCHKHEVQELLRGLCRDAELDDPDATAEMLYLLVEGAVVTAGPHEDTAPIIRARAIAADILQRASKTAPDR
jgi:AcrR family transcriptional regulator